MGMAGLMGSDADSEPEGGGGSGPVVVPWGGDAIDRAAGGAAAGRGGRAAGAGGPGAEQRDGGRRGASSERGGGGGGPAEGPPTVAYSGSIGLPLHLVFAPPPYLPRPVSLCVQQPYLGPRRLLSPPPLHRGACPRAAASGDTPPAGPWLGVGGGVTAAPPVGRLVLRHKTVSPDRQGGGGTRSLARTISLNQHFIFLGAVDHRACLQTIVSVKISDHKCINLHLQKFVIKK